MSMWDSVNTKSMEFFRKVPIHLYNFSALCFSQEYSPDYIMGSHTRWKFPQLPFGCCSFVFAWSDLGHYVQQRTC